MNTIVNQCSDCVKQGKPCPYHTEIDRAERRAMHCLSEWVNSLRTPFNPIEILELKRRLIAEFREYETQIENLKGIK